MSAPAELQHFLDGSVENGSSFRWAGAVVTRDKIYDTQVAGHADPVAQVPLTPDAIFWMASASKLPLTLALFAAIDKGDIKGFTLNDLDNPDALTSYCPELAVGSGHPFMMLWQGWADEEARKPNPYKPATKPVTLRHLLTWTAGSPGRIYASHVHLLRDKGPNETFILDFDSCHPDALAEPRITEAGAPDSFGYAGSGNYWIGVFLSRALGRTQRKAVDKYILQPLGISQEDLSYYISPSMRKPLVSVHVNTPVGWQPIPLEPTSASWDGEPPEGWQEDGNAGFYGTIGAFATILQTVLKQDEHILSKSTWDYVVRDDLARRTIYKVTVTLPDPLWGNDVPFPSHTVKLENADVGVTLLQALYGRHPTSYGCQSGTFSWYGLTNLAWWVDLKSGVAGVVSTHSLPFFGEEKVAVWRGYMKRAYEVTERERAGH